MQRAQAQQVVQGLSLTNSARRAVGRFDLAAVTLATIAFASFLLLPTSAPRPAAASPSSRAAMNAVRATALAHLATISRSFEAGLTPEQRHSAAARQARAVLAHLESALHHAQTADEALRAISQAQQDLQRLRAGLHPITHQAAAGLNQALSNYMTPQERRVSSQRAEQVASSLLDRLARTATRGSEQERAAEARALASAANKIPDSQLRADLRAAASAIGHHNMQLARQALQHAAQRAARSPADKQTQSRLKRTSSKLDSLKNAVSQIHGSTARALSEKGKLAAVTNGQTNRSRGGANRGSAQSVGATGSGPGDSALNEKGQQHGVGGPATEKLGKPSSSSNAGNYNTVYVPGIAGAGSHLLPVDLRGAPRRGQVVPYQQVIGHYRQTARTALERSQLPPSLRNYVRRYFTALAR